MMIPIWTDAHRERSERFGDSGVVQPGPRRQPADTRRNGSGTTISDKGAVVPSQARLDAKRARATYRQSILDGKPLTDNALGAMYGRSRTWGAQRKDEVDAAITDQLDDTCPPSEPEPAGHQHIERHGRTDERHEDQADAGGDDAGGDLVRRGSSGPAAGDPEPAPEHTPAPTMRQATATEPGGDPAIHQHLQPAATEAPAEAPTAPLTPPATDGTSAGKRGGIGAHLVVWTALVVGIGVSIAANVMNTQLITDQPAAWVGSAFWPIALLLALEIVTRVPWPATTLYTIARIGGVGIVAAVAAIQSYRHMANLLLSWGEDALSSHLGPFAVDGLMITAATALLALHASHAPRTAKKAPQR